MERGEAQQVRAEEREDLRDPQDSLVATEPEEAPAQRDDRQNGDQRPEAEPQPDETIHEK